MLDLDHPHSAHILRAARHLDALQALGQQLSYPQPPHLPATAAAELAALDLLSATEFAGSRTSAQAQLHQLAACFGLLPAPAPADAPARLAAALAQLGQDFGTWLI